LRNWPLDDSKQLELPTLGGGSSLSTTVVFWGAKENKTRNQREQKKNKRKKLCLVRLPLKKENEFI
jgi:hypothetical protein